jgi:hypothetical protein
VGEEGSMTYLDKYRKCKSVGEIIAEAKRDVKVALFIGGDPDRLKAIEEAVNEAIDEREEE